MSSGTRSRSPRRHTEEHCEVDADIAKHATVERVTLKIAEKYLQNGFGHPGKQMCVQRRVNKTAPLQDLMADYCRMSGLQSSQVRFLVGESNANTIAPDDTAEKLGLWDGHCIIADESCLQVQAVHAISGDGLCAVKVHPSWTGLFLKRSIAQITGICERQLRLLFQDAVLDNDQKLGELHYTGEELLVAVIQLHENWNGWRRVQSSTDPSVFYYYCPTIGARVEPPEPWVVRLSRTLPNVHYYWNPVTGETSVEKPVV